METVILIGALIIVAVIAALLNKPEENAKPKEPVSTQKGKLCPLLASGLLSNRGRSDKGEVFVIARCHPRCEWFVESENCYVMIVGKNG